MRALNCPQGGVMLSERSREREEGRGLIFSCKMVC